jgi:hypothetical protein
MIPSIDLMLATLERALSVAIMPAAGNAAARQEATLGILFARWLRDVADHAVDAERASYRDCRAALADVVALVSARRRGPALSAFSSEARELLAKPSAEAAAAVREKARVAKALLGRALRAAREDGDDAAPAIRRLLADLAARELEREIAFGKVTGIDPDGAKGPSLAEVLAAEKAQRTEASS